MLKIIIDQPAAMQAFGSQLARHTPAASVLFLYGELGAGKTTLVRGFLNGLGHTGIVKSPTYTLVELYEMVNPPVYHFDLYRLHDPEELEAMGIRDYFDKNAILLIEWPERAGQILPAPDLCCYIGLLADGREVELKALTERGHSILQHMSGDPA